MPSLYKKKRNAFFKLRDFHSSNPPVAPLEKKFLFHASPFLKIPKAVERKGDGCLESRNVSTEDPIDRPSARQFSNLRIFRETEK